MAKKVEITVEPHLDPDKAVIADLGTLSKKKIKRLKKGKGKGWKKLSRAVADIHAGGHGDREVVIVLVRESPVPSQISSLLPF